jgi:hypothetical protein
MTLLGQTLGAVRSARAAAVVVLAWALCAAVATTANAAVPTDGRVWELATTGPDNGVQLLGVNGWTQDGNTIAYGSLGPLPGAPSGELIAQSVATRAAQGWQTRRVGVPFTAPRTELFMTRAFGVSSDFRTWLWGSVNPLLPGAPSFPSFGLYRLAPDGRLTLLGDLGGTFSQLVEDPEGVSDDTQHVALSDSARLLPEDERQVEGEGRLVGRAAYEFNGTTMRLAGVEDGGAPISHCGGSVVGNGLGDPRLGPNPTSRDGSKVFFTAPSPESTYYCPDEVTHVYMRVNGTHTVDVSASRCTLATCQGPSMMHFSGATPDGAYVFVTSNQQMTDEDRGEEGLVRIATDTGDVTLISDAGSGPSGTAEEGPIEFSADGQRVAFVGYGELIPGRGAPGQRSVYVWDHGQLHFVGEITGTESTEGDLKSANMSGDGGVLVFDTASQLLPSDTDESVDVYRYDVTSDTLTQVSLGSGGTGNGAFEATTSNIAGGGFPSQVPRTVSADGSRAFFDTREALLPEDHNDQQDVYEWHDGTLGLVSPATAGNASTFQGISSDGRDAFFMTDSTLTPNDQDNGDIDVYDARIGGGFRTEPPPGEEPPSREPPSREPPPGGGPPPPGCSGACQGPLPTPGDRSRPAPRGRRTAPIVNNLALARLSAALRAQLVRRGAAVIVVRGAVAGRLTLRGVARIGRRQQLAASGATRVRRAGTVSVRLRLTAVARRALRKRGATLRVTLTVAQPGGHTSARMVIVLRGRSS